MSDNNLYLSSKGRVGRWSWWIASIAIFTASLLASGIASNESAFLRIIGWILMIVFAAAQINVSVKRLHDLDKSGWYYLIAIIPIGGWLVIIIWLGFVKGTTGTNKYGDDPLQKKP